MTHPVWIWQYEQWPHFCWNDSNIISLLARVRQQQGQLLGLMSSMGFDTQSHNALEVMTEDILRNAEIEGMLLNPDHVRSSVARHLGLDCAGMPEADHYTEGVVQVLMDAVQHANAPLTEERLFNWHAALFPTGRSGITAITVAAWRQGADPMQVVSGAIGKEQVHYQAPPSECLPQEMEQFLRWINSEESIDPVLKAAIAHLWFVNVHPFDDGNGRLTRTITDMLLARADGSSQRFYSMSAAILRNKKGYYEILEYIGKHGMDITPWLIWFLETMEDAITTAQTRVQRVVQKTLFWQKHVATPLNERQVKIINRLWDGLEGKLNTSKWAKMTHTSSATALRDIQDLVQKGILRDSGEGGRNTNYVLHEHKSCPRCGAAFICQHENPAKCQCAGVELSPATRTHLAAQYPNQCLCRKCLLEFSV
ncbi:MAG: cysteine-rich CWC family protein [Paludibacteraceae bacterium]|nr:cysteine-rich CWC family protein [Paludibacteraceae bacterium]